jgi:hypothetical protein
MVSQGGHLQIVEPSSFFFRLAFEMYFSCGDWGLSLKVRHVNPVDGTNQTKHL